MSKKFYNTPAMQLTECVMMKFAICSGNGGDTPPVTPTPGAQSEKPGTSGNAPGRVF